jgi:hypothetical protein
MIPTRTTEIWHDDPALLSGLPGRAEADSDYLDGNRMYEPELRHATWQDASRALQVERDRLAVASAAGAEREFESLFDGDLEDWEMIETFGLDLGVAAAVLALNAAGCLTSSSCRGHDGYVGDHGRPWIRVYADPARGSLVAAAAKRSGCGFAIDGAGVALLYAASIVEMLGLAEQVMDSAPAFDSLPSRRFRKASGFEGDAR